MPQNDVTAVVLAAGKGTRMKSEHAKVLHEIFFAPMIHHVLDSLQSLELGRTVVVTGHQRDQVQGALGRYGVTFVEQDEQHGTGHAVLCAEKEIADGGGGTVLILCGDTPLIRSKTLQDFTAAHRESGAVLSVMTTHLDDPTNYGRIVTDNEGNILCIVEEKDASESARLINEINAGIYCVEAKFLLQALRQVGTDNKQGEVYLTDIVGIAKGDGLPLHRFVCEDAEEVMGVNSRIELAQAHLCLQERRNRELMVSGVTLLNPATTAVEKSVQIGCDTVIHPNVHLGGSCVIGSGCSIGRSAVLKDCQLGDKVTVGPLVYLEGVTLAAGETVPPHLVRYGEEA
ncbi:MAG: NTP transferase domain-containing protein [Desulfobulbaceae bacterium]|nr:NTP transferase domain-containing protein [Desulfobulbaceae bacterium]